MNVSRSAHEILLREGYESLGSFIHDSVLIIALSKIDQYEAECDLFAGKHGMSLEDLESILHKDRGSEDFEKEEDLEDWEFAVHAVKWWKERADELRTSQTH